MPIAAPSPNPEPAPVIRIVFGIVVSFVTVVESFDELLAGEGRCGYLCDLRVLRHGAAGYTDGAEHCAISDSQQDSAAERSQTVICEFQCVCRRARFAIFPD